ncbi:DUF6801 domain-containing protein [Streptomyces sp. NBC_00847]|uniref:DUF6801 domain-containing protein n=1 Tax=unclassified Streptomyces TaxID=2593676 RepID=UPI00224CC49F|nr:DUF6801 domain-containing protein [Streptomyces sp. NBC_00847]MCX4882414.1 hypothetical protein [Streptomyces sp. NBC_00847]
MVADLASAGSRRRVARYVTAVALLGSAGLVGAGSATAAPAPHSVHYTCGFPYIGDKPMTASVAWPAPPAYVVGRAAPRSALDATATVGGNVSGSLRLIGATTVEGTADVRTVAAAPAGDKPVNVTFEVPRTAVPESGDLTVRASGTLPSLTFGKAGGAKLVFGHIDLHLTPRDANGGKPMGDIDAPCDLNSGQDGQAAAFTIRTAAAEPSAPGTVKAPRPGAGDSGTSESRPATGSGSGSGSGPASSSASGSAPDSVSAKGGAPARSPGGTTPASHPGTPGGTASPAAAETDGTGAVGPLRVVAVSLAVGAGVLGAGWWGRRRLRTKGR